MKLSLIKNKKVLILGMGREGVDSLKFFLKTFPDKEICVADRREYNLFDSVSQKILKRKNVTYFLGDNYLDSIKFFEVIVKSPGIKINDIKKYIDKKTVVTSQANIFFDNCPGKIIGITGTKGKSTTASLIYSILKQAGKKVYLVGNIEKPSLSFLFKAKAGDFFVYELSSYQLKDLKKSPFIAVFLNFYPEHLDYHGTLKDYFESKINIARYQKKQDYFIFNPEIKNIPLVDSKKIVINENFFSDFINKNDWLKKITHTNNIVAVLNVCKILKIKEKDVLNGFKKFKKLDHRLQYVGCFDGIKFFDDSISTIPEATVYALDVLGLDVETLILGGHDRGIKYNKLKKKLSETKVKNILLFRPSGEKIKKEIGGSYQYFFVSDMKKAVEKCFKITSPGKICLLSPSAPSFGLFKDYKDRGDNFQKEIKLNEKK